MARAHTDDVPQSHRVVNNGEVLTERKGTGKEAFFGRSQGAGVDSGGGGGAWGGGGGAGDGLRAAGLCTSSQSISDGRGRNAVFRPPRERTLRRRDTTGASRWSGMVIALHGPGCSCLTIFPSDRLVIRQVMMIQRSKRSSASSHTSVTSAGTGERKSAMDASAKFARSSTGRVKGRCGPCATCERPVSPGPMSAGKCAVDR